MCSCHKPGLRLLTTLPAGNRLSGIPTAVTHANRRSVRARPVWRRCDASKRRAVQDASGHVGCAATEIVDRHQPSADDTMAEQCADALRKGAHSRWREARPARARPHTPRPAHRRRRSDRKSPSRAAGSHSDAGCPRRTDCPTRRTSAVRRSAETGLRELRRQNRPRVPAPVTTNTCFVRGSNWRMSSINSGKSLATATAASFVPRGASPRYPRSAEANTSGVSGKSCGRYLRRRPPRAQRPSRRGRAWDDWRRWIGCSPRPPARCADDPVGLTTTWTTLTGLPHALVEVDPELR